LDFFLERFQTIHKPNQQLYLDEAMIPYRRNLSRRDSTPPIKKHIFRHFIFCFKRLPLTFKQDVMAAGDCSCWQVGASGRLLKRSRLQAATGSFNY
jgi:hypothetical protein